MSDVSPGPRGRCTLTVAVLVALASLPTLAVVAAGSAWLSIGTERRSPFASGRAEPPVVVVPGRPPPTTGFHLVQPPRARPPLTDDGVRRPGGPHQPPRQAGRTAGAVPTSGTADPLGWSDRTGTPQHHPRTRPRQRKPERVGGNRGGSQAPGRSMAGWSRPAGPRR